MSATDGPVRSAAAQRLRTLAWLLPSIAAVIVGAAYATRPVYDLVTELGWFTPSPTDPDRLFLKVFRRLLLIPLLVIIGLWLRPWRDAHAAAVGLRGPNARHRMALWTFLATWACGAAVVAWQMGEGWLVWEEPLRMEKVLTRFGKYMALGVCVAFAEEWFFRGWLWRHIGRGQRTLMAAVLCSVIYGLAHAFRPGALDHEVTLDAAGAFDALHGWLLHATDIVSFGPRFLGLFLLGLMLCALYRRRGNLWSAVGVHAAGISWIYGYSSFTQRPVRHSWAGTKVLYDGWPVWVLLLAVTIWLVRTRRPLEGYQAQDAD